MPFNKQRDEIRILFASHDYGTEDPWHETDIKKQRRRHKKIVDAAIDKIREAMMQRLQSGQTLLGYGPLAK